MVWFGYLFRSDIHCTHIVNFLHRHVTEHFEFFLFNFPLHYLQIIGSGGMSDIHLKSVKHQVQSQGTVGALAWRVKMRLGLHDHGMANCDHLIKQVPSTHLLSK
jgi:hypothetical protein